MPRRSIFNKVKDTIKRAEKQIYLVFPECEYLKAKIRDTIKQAEMQINNKVKTYFPGKVSKLPSSKKIVMLVMRR